MNDYKERAVHHALPRMDVAMCGVKVPELRRGTIGAISWTDGKTSASSDVSDVTCVECRKALYDVLPEKEVQSQMADAGWLRTQGEDFASLKKLVLAVNAAEELIVAADEPFKKETRAQFVLRAAKDLDRALMDPSIARRISGGYTNAGKHIATVAPAGGLCHDDAATIIRHVRTSVDALRAGRAWPDDARIVAAFLEKTVEEMLGVKREGTVIETSFACAGGCGGALAVGATAGGLCEKCMKAADGQRRNARPL